MNGLLVADGERQREGGADRPVVDVAVGVLMKARSMRVTGNSQVASSKQVKRWKRPCAANCKKSWAS